MQGTTASDITGTVKGTYNLIGTGGAGGLVNGRNGNIVGVSNPLFATLSNYGGTTETIALLPGSPALGAGTPVSGITTDQRGMPLDSPHPDIGAFQSQGFTLVPIAGSTSQTAATGTAFANPLAVTVTANNPLEPVAGGVISFGAPAAGASATLSSNTATIGDDGTAAISATANGKAGSYAVTASAGGANAPASFSLTNTGSSSIAASLPTNSGNSPSLVDAALASILGTFDDAGPNPNSWSDS